jgi:hypothetical protein
MVPPDPPFGRGRRGEERVYQLLRHALPESHWWVFYNLRFFTDGSCTQSRELDFVIVHEFRGCLFLEVKGGGYEHDPELGWCRRYGGRLSPDSHGGPYAQLNSASHLFLQAATKALGWNANSPPIRWGMGVAFPFNTLTRIDGRLPPDADGAITAEEQVFESADRLRDWVLARFRQIESRFGHATQQSTESLQTFMKRFLAPRIQSTSRLASLIARTKEAEDLLTIEQRAVVRMLASRPILLVAGFAGTGKTFMAVHHAVTLEERSRASANGQRIAIVCFNANLARFIRSDMLPPDSKVEAIHFHALCERAAREAGFSEPAVRDEQYFRQGCVDRLMMAWDQGGLRQYDAIIIDEGQDFEPSWIESLQDCLLSQNGKFAVFYDPLQDLYRISEHLPKRLGAAYPITTNCRNTVRICEFVKSIRPAELQDLRPAELAPVGASPQIIRYASDDDQRSRLDRLIKDLTETQGLRPPQIMLLAPFQRHNTCLSNVDQLGGFRIGNFSDRDSLDRECTVLVETVHSFKGLDADAVILFDVRDEGWASDVSKLYVASSRARFGLWIFCEKTVRLPTT